MDARRERAGSEARRRQQSRNREQWVHVLRCARETTGKWLLILIWSNDRKWRSFVHKTWFAARHLTPWRWYLLTALLYLLSSISWALLYLLSSNLMRRRRSHRHWIVGLMLARFLLNLLEEEIRNADMKTRTFVVWFGRTVVLSWTLYIYIYIWIGGLHSWMLSSESFTVWVEDQWSIFICHDLYPFLRPHLTDAQIEARAEGNRRPLSVDEKVGIGLMTSGGCTLGGILQGFNIGKTCVHLKQFNASLMQ
jgi:hypothetical protein